MQSKILREDQGAALLTSLEGTYKAFATSASKH